MLILASRSATRKALLAGAGLRFESSPAPVDERAIEAGLVGKDPKAVAQKLAEAKALAVSHERPEATVIGADQVLAFTSLLHKPHDLGDARHQLQALRGKTHHLHAGVAVARAGALLWSDVESAALTLREFPKRERWILIQTVFRTRSWPGFSMAAKGIADAADIRFTSCSGILVLDLVTRSSREAETP